ncbi:MAG: pirin family protein [Ignavibacteriaceae bacterium]|nr:pirin family protein [Ignavibacteriaceae bacterium]
MITAKRNSKRGYTKFEWLESYHSFSFGSYYDADNINFGPLRVINDDIVAPGGGFPMHPHQNMEIVTYVLSGALEHKDSTGTHEVIRAGELQKMTAGKGVYHSEFNSSQNNSVHLLQIWILPNKAGLEPSYDQRSWSTEERKNKLLKVASPNMNEDTIFINQDASIFISTLEDGNELPFQNIDGRGTYIHIIEGEVKIDNEVYSSGDAIEITGDELFKLKAEKKSELIVFELAMNFN